MTNALRAMGALDQTHRSVSIPSKTHQRKVIEFHRFEILRGMRFKGRLDDLLPHAWLAARAAAGK